MSLSDRSLILKDLFSADRTRPIADSCNTTVARRAVNLAAGSLPAEQRRKVILFGVAMALVFLIGFALIATWLLSITGLVLAGGFLLLWVAFNMYRELHPAKVVIADDPDTPQIEGPPATKTFLQAAVQITLADLSMSLDNVLAVAGAAREHPGILIVGLIFAVALMGVAANIIAQYIERYRWIAWVGLVVIVYVAGKMIWEGWHEVQPHVLAFAGM